MKDIFLTDRSESGLWTMTRADDDSLVAACNGADADAATAAFEALYRRHRNYVLRVALRFTHDRELAADVLQETFTYLLGQFPPPGRGLTLTARLTTYLYPIAKNFAISAARKAERFDSGDRDPDSYAHAEARSMHGDEIDRALAALTVERREVLTLRFVDGMSLAEISDALQIPAGTVKSRLHLALKQLKETPEIKDLFDA